MFPVPEKNAHSDRMSHAFRPGMGYVQVGKLLPATNPIAGKEACEPVAPAADGSIHFLNPPMGAQPMMMKWHPAQREWTPMVLGAGKRLGYTSEYLAGHGWAYMGPAPQEP